MFMQMVDVVSWFHSHGISHLDLSLENTMLASNSKTDPRIKIIDFGLAKFFKANEKLCEKVGKVGYMAPEVYAKKEYSPEKADIWCLGVMLFMMLVGAPPYEFPSPTNPAYRFIIGGRLRDVLVHWRRLPLVSEEALDVMLKIFKPENDRVSIQELRQHKYVALPSLTSTTEPEAPTVSESVKEEEKDRKVITTGKDRTLSIKSEAIPWVDTKQAQEIAYQLRGTVGVDNIRVIVTSIEQSIQNASQRTQVNSEHAPKDGENPKAEGVTDEDHKSHGGSYVEELKKLLQVAKDALETNTT
jgi:serine/threonine protein kinase